MASVGNRKARSDAPSAPLFFFVLAPGLGNAPQLSLLKLTLQPSKCDCFYLPKAEKGHGECRIGAKLFLDPICRHQFFHLFRMRDMRYGDFTVYFTDFLLYNFSEMLWILFREFVDVLLDYLMVTVNQHNARRIDFVWWLEHDECPRRVLTDFISADNPIVWQSPRHLLFFCRLARWIRIADSQRSARNLRLVNPRSRTRSWSRAPTAFRPKRLDWSRSLVSG